MTKETEIDKDFFLAEISKTNPVIFDIGCYDGADSREFSHLFENPTIYAFEGDKRSVDLFNKLSKGDDNIKLVETVLSDTNGEVDWFSSDSDTKRHYEFQDSWSASSSLKKPDNHLNVFKDVSFSKAPKVQSMTLDSWMKDNSHIDSIDVIWADVNGGEEELLNGAQKTLQKTKFLYIEFNATQEKKLYSKCLTKEEIKNKLPDFEELGVYNFKGNFGNVLLQNKNEF